MSPTIAITGNPTPHLLERLRRHFVLHELPTKESIAALPADIAAKVRGVASVGHAGVDAALIDRLPALEIIAHFGVGYDPVDIGAAARRSIVVTNTPDVLTDEVADATIGLLIMTVRELSAAEAWLRAGNWESRGPYPLTPGSLRGRSVGIVGLGRIGQAIVKRVEAFGLPIAYHSRSAVPGAPYPHHTTAKSLAAAVDTLIVVAPGTAATHHMIDADVLAALGPDGILVNIGRGSVVDEAALVEALRAGTILGAGLDVFEDEPRVHPGLLDLPRVVLLPHVGSASEHTRKAMGDLQADNLIAWFDGRAPLTPVPETPVRER
jgi:lactate dehydrogenase-like 2-hydroxyacid dehydrogenase